MNLASSSEARITLRDKFRAATREAILEAAAGLLTAEGGAHVRMEDIAATAGIAVGTLYNYFRDRTALVSALLESRTRGLFEGLDQSCSPSPAGDRTPATAFASELEHFVGAVCRHFDANRFLLSVLVEEERQRGVDATVVSRRRANRRPGGRARGAHGGAQRAGARRRLRPRRGARAPRAGALRQRRPAASGRRAVQERSPIVSGAGHAGAPWVPGRRGGGAHAERREQAHERAAGGPPTEARGRAQPDPHGAARARGDLGLRGGAERGRGDRTALDRAARSARDREPRASAPRRAAARSRRATGVAQPEGARKGPSRRAAP